MCSLLHYTHINWLIFNISVIIFDYRKQGKHIWSDRYLQMHRRIRYQVCQQKFLEGNWASTRPPRLTSARGLVLLPRRPTSLMGGACSSTHPQTTGGVSGLRWHCPVPLQAVARHGRICSSRRRRRQQVSVEGLFIFRPGRKWKKCSRRFDVGGRLVSWPEEIGPFFR